METYVKKNTQVCGGEKSRQYSRRQYLGQLSASHSPSDFRERKITRGLRDLFSTVIIIKPRTTKDASVSLKKKS